MTFTFLHAADLHLDSPLRGLAQYEGAPEEALRSATRRAFEALIELAIETRVAFVLLAGDLYDGDWKDYHTGLFFHRQMVRLEQAGIPVFLVAGNHDAASRITRQLKLPANVTSFPTQAPGTHTLDALKVAIHGQGYPEGAVKEDLAAHYPPPVAGLFNIGLLHTSLDGRPGHAAYAPCTVATLRARGYDYWALGHVHQREEVATDPHVIYPGCIQGRHVRETGAKGCTLVTVEADVITQLVHQPLDVVRWAVCGVALDGAEDESAVRAAIRSALTGALEEADGRLLAARVVLEGATPLHASIHAAPERWENQVRALAAEIDEELLWVEKLKLATRETRERAGRIDAGTPLAGLIESVLKFPATLEDGNPLFEDIEALRKKLPAELFVGADEVNLEDTARVAALVEAGREQLVARLLTGGDEPA